MSAAEHPSVIGGDPAVTAPGVADKDAFRAAAHGEGLHPITINDDLVLTTKDDFVKFVRNRVGRVDFNDVVQHGRVDPDYSLVFAGRIINVGGDLTSRVAVAKQLAPHGIPLPYLAPTPWGHVSACLVTLAFANVEDGDDGAEEAREWLAAYYGERGDSKTVDAVAGRAPFVSEGLHYLNRNHFVQWVQRSMAKVPADDIKRRLHRLGFTNAGMVNVTGESSARGGRSINAKASNRYYAGPSNLSLPGRQHNTDTED